MSHSYRAYGLGIVSAASISGLESSYQNAERTDLCLETGSQPAWAARRSDLPGRVLSRRPESLNPVDPAFILTEFGNAEMYELYYSDGTRFVVDRTGTRVWGSCQTPLTFEDLITYFLGPVMGFLLRARHITCLHASCVQVAGSGIALSGDAGFGKSTTAAALALRGFPVLSEDIVPLKETTSGTLAVPGYPRICLWPDAVSKLLGSPDALPQLTAGWEKRFLALDGTRAKFCREELPLGLIYLFAPRAEERTAPRIEEMSQREALLALVQNTYMNWLLDREQRAKEFDALVRLVSHVPVRRIVPHADPGKIGALCELIAQDANTVLASKVSASPYTR